MRDIGFCRLAACPAVTAHGVANGKPVTEQPSRKEGMSVREMSKIMIAALLIVLVSGCCVKFEDVAPGTQYPVGQTFYTSGTNITVEQFQWTNGTWTTSGKARIDATNHAKGTGREINANNVNLRFKFDYPLKKITLKFAELGGNNNMMVNGDFRNVGNLASLNGTTVGGVTVTVTATAVGGNSYGVIVLDGAVKEFSIGGQELWLDDICPTK